MNNKFKKGISVIICCHNSKDKIRPTLEHLQKQLILEYIPWEVILVDNASDDLTAHTAESIWAKAPVANLRIVEEDKLGLIFARLRGLSEAKYEFISFIDDDNWVAENWISLLYNVMSGNPQIGACGGLNSAVFEAPPPDWFDRFEKSYAVGQQASAAGDITNGSGVLCGAGLSVRKEAWDHLQKNGFTFSLVGRRGNQLFCGEDYELCLAIKLAGWKIWYEPSLKVKHYLPRGRLTWKYLRRLMEGVGYSHAFLIPYQRASNESYESPNSLWWESVRYAARNLIRKPHKLILSLITPLEGDSDSLWVMRSYGMLRALLIRREKFKAMVADIKTAEWVRIGSTGDSSESR